MIEKPENIAAEESHKLQQHEKVKDKLREDVHQKIQQSADKFGDGEAARMKGVADELKAKTIREVGETENQLERTKKICGVWQAIDYLFYLAYGLIGMEIILELLGARDSSGFKQFIDTVSYPLLAPFRGLLFDPGVGPFRLMLSFLFALFFYVLLHFAIKKLVRIMTHSSN